MLAILISGGPVMIPIALCAVIATAIIIERMLFFRELKSGDRDLLPRIRASVEKGHYDEAAAICDTVESPVSRLLKVGIEYREYSEAAIKEAVMNQANREIPRIERYLSTLGTIASVSTLLGLLGSVTGIIGAFGVIGGSGEMGNPAQLASAISNVLVTTAAGLCVAIPALVFHNYLVSRVNSIVVGMESSVSDLVLLLTVRKGSHEVQA